MTIGDYFSGLLGGLKSLGIGMGVTWKELFTKKVTQQYPENRKTLVIPSRVRGELTMPHDENNEHACTSCGICQMNCPNGTIKIASKIIETEDGKKKKILDVYTYDLGMCTFCNLCVLTCPSDAIKFSTEFENAVFRRKSLKQVLNHEGSKLREKKKVAPVAPVSDTPKVEKKVVVKDEQVDKIETPKAEVAPKVEAPKAKEVPSAKVNKKEEVSNLQAEDKKSLVKKDSDASTDKNTNSKPNNE